MLRAQAWRSPAAIRAHPRRPLEGWDRAGECQLQPGEGLSWEALTPPSPTREDRGCEPQLLLGVLQENRPCAGRGGEVPGLRFH